MAKIGRPGLPSEKRQQVWDMWKAGRSIGEISRSVGSPPESIFSILLPYGGIYQRPQKRRPGTLTFAEREEVSRGLAAGLSYRAIGERLGRAASTISREVARNKGRAKYRAVDADDRAWRRVRRPQRCKLAKNPVLRGYVAARLRQDWLAQSCRVRRPSVNTIPSNKCPRDVRALVPQMSRDVPRCPEMSSLSTWSGIRVARL